MMSIFLAKIGKKLIFDWLLIFVIFHFKMDFATAFEYVAICALLMLFDFLLKNIIQRVFNEPAVEPAVEPTAEPTAEPAAEPAVEPTVEPTAEPKARHTVIPRKEIYLSDPYRSQSLLRLKEILKELDELLPAEERKIKRRGNTIKTVNKSLIQLFRAYLASIIFSLKHMLTTTKQILPKFKLFLFFREL